MTSSLRPLRVAAVAAATACVLASGGAVAWASAPTAQPASPSVSTSTRTPLASVAIPQVDGKTHTVTYDKSAYLVDGNPLVLYSGEFHYFRLPSQSMWKDVLQKMKAGGFNAVSLYFDWGYHSSEPGKYDFTGIRDVDTLLDMAADAGLYVIARPGPYINAEVTGGGFPSYLTTTEGETRTDAADYMKYADEWMSQINAILSRHQVTNGTGSVVAYQVENEYYARNYTEADAGSDTYLRHLMDRARAEGISVPLIGNHNGSRSDIVEVDGPDRYPGGVSCSNDSWPTSPDTITNDKQPNGPMSVPEYAAAWYQGWGGANYEDCANNGYGSDFVDVFYKDALGQGATLINYYMAYGGTNWGWTNDARNQTSYDYGAGITEGRQLRDKYQTNKLIGYFAQSQPDLTEAGDPDHLDKISGATLTEQQRINTTSGAQYDFLRHTNIQSKSSDEARLWVATSGSELVDDTDSRLKWDSGWNAASNEGWTTGDYRQTEHWTGGAASVSLTFSGPAVSWYSSYSDNHGPADVYIDGQKVATVTTKSNSAEENRESREVFSKNDLSDGQHTISIKALGQGNVSVDAIGVGQHVFSAPENPDSRLYVQGRQSLVLMSNVNLGDSRLEYSTSQPVTNLTTASGRTVALFHNVKGSRGETALHFDQEPTVDGDSRVASTWDATSGTLTLNYTHDGLADVTVTPVGGHPLELLFADTDTAKHFWVAGEGDARTLVHGSSLVRTAVLSDGVLALDGDNAEDPQITVYTDAANVTWNGAGLQQATRSGSQVTGTIRTAEAVSLPSLDNWKLSDENPESDPGFDDASWKVADKTDTYSDHASSSDVVLLANEYGYDSGNTWYRGHFTGSTAVTGVRLNTPIFSDGGRRYSNAVSVWLNGTFLGSFTDSAGQTFEFPKGVVRNGQDNVISVLTVNMGDTRNHERDRYKEGRGLGGAELLGATPGAVTWKIQGVVGGYETWADTVRGPQSTGGLFGEREGWSLPGFDDSEWTTSDPTTPQSRAGVSWYRTSVTLDTPQDQDTSVAVAFDAPERTSERVRVLIFVNGWNIGQYIPSLGPQTSFPVPNGILDTHGENSIALAVWRLDGEKSQLPKVFLQNLGSVTSRLAVTSVDNPGYDQVIASRAVSDSTAKVSVGIPSTMPASESFDITGTVEGLPEGSSDVRPNLELPQGWEVEGPVASATDDSTFVWHVSAPSRTSPVPGEQAVLTVAYSTGGSSSSVKASATLPYTALHGAGLVLSEQPTGFESSEWSQVERNRSVNGSDPDDGNQMSLNGQTVVSGFGTHAPSRLSFHLGGQCTSISTLVGIDGEVGSSSGSVTFSLEGDGSTLGSPVTVRGGGNSSTLSADNLSGVQNLTLVSSDAGDGNGNDHADWANTVLNCGDAPVASADLTDGTRGGVTAPPEARPGETITLTVNDPRAAEYTTYMFPARRDLGTESSADGALTVKVPADATPGEHRIAVTTTDGTLIGWAPIQVVDQVDPAQPVTTSTTLELSADKAVEGSTDTVLAEVTVTGLPADGSGGTVAILDGDEELVGPLSLTEGGVVSTPLPANLAVGSHALRAVFTPQDPAAHSKSQSEAVELTVTAKGTDPEPVHTVTPAGVTFSDAPGTDKDTYTIPESEGVDYTIAGKAVRAGTYPGEGEVIVLARAREGYALADGSTDRWSHVFTSASPEPSEPAPDADAPSSGPAPDADTPSSSPAGESGTAGRTDGEDLAKTGTNAGLLAGLTAVLLALGWGIRMASRRRG